jgi:imidazole glycerol-phosphate synthase subunit HisH
MIGIIDYGMGNVRSVANALAYLGLESTVTSDPGELRECDRLILPGVGAFGDAMEQLRARGLVDVLDREAVEGGKPLLGICLGMQLLARASEEHGRHEGLGWFDAEVVRFHGTAGLKVPHMGWNTVGLHREHPLFAGLSAEQRDFYFVHSFHVVCRDDTDVVGTAIYGTEITVAMARGNIAGMQFHPEKSQDNGLQILSNFATWTPASAGDGAVLTPSA